MRRWLLPALTAALVVSLAATAGAQRFYRSSPIDAPIDKAPAYDGRFVFARLKFNTAPGGYYYGGS